MAEQGFAISKHHRQVVTTLQNPPGGITMSEILELTTVRQRQKIKIDSTEYEMKDWGELR